MHAFLRYAQQRRREIVDQIGACVRCESPSGSPAQLNAFLDLLVEQTAGFAKAKRVHCGRGTYALLLQFETPGRAKSGRVLGVGHADTVWPAGTLERMPFREARGRLWGPGVLDMKAGLVFFIRAVQLLRDLDIPVRRQVHLLIVPDEERGSRDSRPLTELEAQKSDAVLVLEPGTGLGGKLKTARKGVGRYSVTVRGKAAHAGVDFQAGASAIVELAHQIGQISKMTNLKAGTTLNPGVIRGGTGSNVIAAEASAEIDVRIVRSELADEVDGKLRALRPRDPRCQVVVEGGVNRPPMERSADIARLFAEAVQVGEELGITVEESSTGGGSDGNFTAALGIPTLDGLGAVGEGAHADTESILVNRIPDRIALLAGLLSRV